MDDSLARAARAAGLIAEYWDGLGARRELGDQTARALLRALGLATQDTSTVPAAPPAMPSALVITEGHGVELDLPAGLLTDEIGWTLICENGDTATGHATRAAGADAARVHLEGLPADLPPGYHRLRLSVASDEIALIVVPARCHLPALLEHGGRVWGLSVQLYALRSRRNWGMGDFGDLARLVRAAAAAGAGVVGLNPLHARHLARPDEASPYAPSSRSMLDPLYLDIEAMPDYAHCAAARARVAAADFQERLAAARAAPLVDHAAVAMLKLEILALLHARFEAEEAAGPRRDDFAAFVREEGAALERHALFQALQRHLADRDGSLPSWREWEDDLRTPESAAVRRFRETNAVAIAFQRYLQWQAARQLQAVADEARDAGMTLGLYRDLAVGAADDGAETWGQPGLAASGVSVGAPPDLLNREGQDWGLPPWNPRTLAERAYRPFADLLRDNMASAGALRIDHVMALTRLFWIPHGMKGISGAYVRNDLAALAGIVALESRRAGCLVIGEDLGSVPDGLRETLANRGFLSYRVLIFERHWDGDGRFKRPWEYPAQALATVATHDMPTIAEWWSGGDIPRRDALGLFPDTATRDDEAQRRTVERERVLDLLRELDLCPSGATLADPAAAGPAVAAALHAVIARTPAMLAMVQLDDVEGETEPANIPGTYREYPNWRRKMTRDLEAIVASKRWAALGETMRAAGRASG